MPQIYNAIICGGTGCEAIKSSQVYDTLINELKNQNIENEVKVIKTGCFGFCEQGPVIKITPDQIYYVRVTPEDIPEIVNEHLIKGSPVKRLIYEIDKNEALSPEKELDFYKKQEKIVLRNCGYIDSEDITEYIAMDGYKGLEKVLFELTPEQVIEELKTSQLRGRGGAGYPTWLKWDFTKNVDSDKKYVVCNADEGDPGAFMDRSVLEGDPHSLIEGMIIAAHTVNANQGYIYVRVEYGLAIQRLKNAISQAYNYGLLGDDILGSGFNFDLDIRLGAGAFVCGEETALLASIEGKRGTPVPRPPYPSVKGLFDKPTVINNVETWANIPYIINNGGANFSKIGTENSKGTKVFCLTGKVKNSVLIEVPMGTTLHEIIYDIGGGILNDKKIKAVQTGGPSGGVIPEDFLDTGVDYENLVELGSMMGSGGMIVLDEDDCMIDIAKFYLKFCVDESCGKCSPCRIGGYQMLKILEKISNGQGELHDITKLEKIAIAMSKGSLCGLGQSAANPVISTLKYFKEEYLKHIEEKKCPAKKCKSLVTYEIIQENCKRCSLCAKNCPVQAIPGDRKTGFEILQDKCIKCGVCYNVCPFDAVKGE